MAGFASNLGASNMLRASPESQRVLSKVKSTRQIALNLQRFVQIDAVSLRLSLFFAIANGRFRHRIGNTFQAVLAMVT